MTAPAGPLVEIVAGVSVAVATVTSITAARLRAQVRAGRVALRLALEREAAFVEAARRLADAARTSIEAVREEMDRAARILAAGIDSVLFFEEIDAELVCVAATGSRTSYFRGARVALDNDASLLVLALRCGHRVTSREACNAKPLHPGDTSAAAVPLVLDAGRRCALYVGGTDPSVLGVIDRIVSLVDQATPAYRIALERADDRSRAEYDGLTGLMTARAFRARLTSTIERARFGPLGRVGLLFVDTDRFKSWNDTYGHASGDALLRELANLLRSAAIDPGDIVARNGGDEFCVVFADSEKSSAVERAEQLRASIADADFSGLHTHGSGSEEVTISASIGVACFPIDAQSPSALLEKADEAMYYSKKTGRNGVSFFSVEGDLVRAGGVVDQAPIDRRQA